MTVVLPPPIPCKGRMTIGITKEAVTAVQIQTDILIEDLIMIVGMMIIKEGTSMQMKIRKAFIRVAIVINTPEIDQMVQDIEVGIGTKGMKKETTQELPRVGKVNHYLLLRSLGDIDPDIIIIIKTLLGGILRSLMTPNMEEGLKGKVLQSGG